MQIIYHYRIGPETIGRMTILQARMLLAELPAVLGIEPEKQENKTALSAEMPAQREGIMLDGLYEAVRQRMKAEEQGNDR